MTLLLYTRTHAHAGLRALLTRSLGYLEDMKKTRRPQVPAERAAATAAAAGDSQGLGDDRAAAPASAAGARVAEATAPAVLCVERVLRLEGYPPPPPTPPPHAEGGAAAAAASLPPPAAVVLLEMVVEAQQLVCPSDMSQTEADDLVGVWVREWACLPDWHTIMRTRAACSSSSSSSSSAGPGRRLQWADMSYAQRRSACELYLLYGPSAANWAPSKEWEAKSRETSSTGGFVTPDFLVTFNGMHQLDKGNVSPRRHSVLATHHQRMRPYHGITVLRRCLLPRCGPAPQSEALGVYPGQAAWNPRGFASGHTTSWVCANIVLPATKVRWGDEAAGWTCCGPAIEATAASTNGYAEGA